MRTTMLRGWMATLCALSISACGPSSETAIRLDVRYDDAWALTELEVASGERIARVSAVHEVLIRLGAEAAEGPLEIVVAGHRGATRYAAGRVSVTPVPGGEVRATVELSRVPCGASCTEGATECQGDAVVACERRGDGCLAWGEPTPCSADAPWCSLGTCGTECIDECAEGERACAGSAGFRVCGEGDSDECLDWLAAIDCADDEVCSLGECRGECVSECTDGAVECRGGAIVRCADRDRDGCLEWGPMEPCPSGQSCQAGTCRAIEDCEDECTANACDALTYRECGDYDLDPCLEPSPGASCVPTDGCREGRCTATGCESSARVCDTPPAPTCVDASTLRVYDAAGTCTAGECQYTSREQACPSCPSCDACAGVSCNTPPSVCYAPTGACSAGACSYAFADGVGCDDGNACTVGDTCASGACTGASRVCNAPPSPCHAAAGTCTGGTCQYAFRDGTACDDGNPRTGDDVCASGICAGVENPWAEIAAGSGHTCIRRASGSVACTGENGDGQLGDGTTTDRTTLASVSGLSDAIAITAGGSHTCAIRSSGSVVCWGGNSHGMIGDGTTTTRLVPTPVTGLTDAVEIDAGGSFTCARRASGTVACWGQNLLGTLGDGTTTTRTTPTPVSGLSGAVELSAGSSHVCARRLSGAVWCWGFNGDGELGDGTRVNRTTPTLSTYLSDATQIAAGSVHTCVRRGAGSIVCWGDNTYGQLGDGTSVGTLDRDPPAPVPVSGLSGVVQVTAGRFHSCARYASGAVACWGSALHGELGDGTRTDRALPVAVSGLSDAVDVVARGVGNRTCARRMTGSIVCWGDNSAGQLGDGTTADRVTPVPMLLP